MFPLFKRPFKESVDYVDPGASVTVLFFFSYGCGHSCARCKYCCPLLCLLQLPGRGGAGAAQALLQHVGVGRLYPLVVILFRFDDLEAKLLVKVNGRLVADLHVTAWRRNKILETH